MGHKFNNSIAKSNCPETSLGGAGPAQLGPVFWHVHGGNNQQISRSCSSAAGISDANRQGGSSVWRAGLVSLRLILQTTDGR